MYLTKIANAIANIRDHNERACVARQIGEVLSDNKGFHWDAWDCECDVFNYYAYCDIFEDYSDDIDGCYDNEDYPDLLGEGNHA